MQDNYYTNSAGFTSSYLAQVIFTLNDGSTSTFPQSPLPAGAPGTFNIGPLLTISIGCGLELKGFSALSPSAARLAGGGAEGVENLSYYTESVITVSLSSINAHS
jgi:hypothetical protein